MLQILFGDPNERKIGRYKNIVNSINALEEKFKEYTDKELQQQTACFIVNISQGKEIDTNLPLAFAAAREASFRVLGLRHFDVQLIGGIILHEGNIAEMKTGEGKTLVAILPAYLNSLCGYGVHVVTVNDYLAKRDAEWVGQVPKFLGLSVGLIQEGMTQEERKQNYSKDITYTTNSELGFDYLRDNMAVDGKNISMSPRFFAIIDEVDSILIDEARTPLVISMPDNEPTTKYLTFSQMAKKLISGADYKIDEKAKTSTLTDT